MEFNTMRGHATWSRLSTGLLVSTSAFLEQFKAADISDARKELRRLPRKACKFRGKSIQENPFRLTKAMSPQCRHMNQWVLIFEAHMCKSVTIVLINCDKKQYVTDAASANNHFSASRSCSDYGNVKEQLHSLRK